MPYCPLCSKSDGEMPKMNKKNASTFYERKNIEDRSFKMIQLVLGKRHVDSYAVYYHRISHGRE